MPSNELNAAMRSSLLAFTEKSIIELNPGTPFLSNWHIDAVCHALDRVREGKVRRLAIALPPRHAKSLCVSVAFVAHLLGNNPSAKVMCASYTQPLATDLSRLTRRIMQCPWYREAFPKATLSAEKAAEDDFETTMQGFRRAVSVHGTVLGRGADILIGDDLMQPDDCRTPEARQKRIDWFRNVFVTRLNDPMTGAIILVMQRLHEQDLIGHIEELGGWEILKIPAIAPEAKRYELSNGKFYLRQAGDLLHPARMDKAALDEKKIEMGEPEFSAQYQQHPITMGANLFKSEYFPRFDLVGLDWRNFDFIFHSWDVASSMSENAAFSVCTIWGVKGRTDFYLLHVFRQRLEIPKLLERAIYLEQRTSPDLIVVESNGIGAALYQGLDAKFGIKRVKSTTCKEDKQIRAERPTMFLATRKVYLPGSATWFQPFWNELSGFPAGAYSDQVDSFTQFITDRKLILHHASLARLIHDGSDCRLADVA